MDIQKVKDFFVQDTLAQTMEIEILQASPEKAVCKMIVSDKFLNARGGIHGGTMYSIADFAFAVASNCGGKITVTLDANISYFRPANDKILIATAELVSNTKHTCNYSVSICDGSDRLLAKVTINGYRTEMEINFD